MQETHVMYYIQIKNPCARKTCNPNRARMFQNVVVYPTYTSLCCVLPTHFSPYTCGERPHIAVPSHFHFFI